MKKYFITLVALLVTTIQMSANTSCSKNDDEDVRYFEQLIELSRKGNADACFSLSQCYKEGRGVRKSELNAFLMYMFYTKRANKDFYDMLNSLDDTNIFKIASYIERKKYSVEDVVEKAQLLRNSNPGDARVLDLFKVLLTDEKQYKNYQFIEQSLKEAEVMGSEMASVIRYVVYSSYDYERSIEYLLEISPKYPALYNIGGYELYEQFKTSEKKDIKLLRTAVKQYLAADMNGILGRSGARNLIYIHETYGNKAFKCSKQEIDRLKILANINSNN